MSTMPMVLIYRRSQEIKNAYMPGPWRISNVSFISWKYPARKDARLFLSRRQVNRGYCHGYAAVCDEIDLS